MLKSRSKDLSPLQRLVAYPRVEALHGPPAKRLDRGLVCFGKFDGHRSLNQDDSHHEVDHDDIG
jgi:hypothetical protein